MALAALGYSQQFNDQHVTQLYGLKWYQYFEFLLPDESHDQHIELQATAFAISNNPEGVAIITKHTSPSLNAMKTLQAIAGSHQQVLISNTTPASLPIYINALGMQDYFGDNNAIAVNQHNREIKHSKFDALSAFMQGRNYDEIIVIGDSEIDMMLAKQAGATGYLYTHAGLPFRSELGDYKINDLIEVLREI
jgi:phosphoglycolate phosphatase-like HAD superfamily hydrolase